MRNLTKVGLSVAACVALVGGLAGPALADTAPEFGDYTLVGSDTLQNLANILVNGTSSTPAWNGNNRSVRVFTFDANGDDQGRGLYAKSSTTTIPTTSVFRRATSPVPRPNGSGEGISALINNSTGGTGWPNSKYPSTTYGYTNLPDNTINIVRSSRLPKVTEKAACVAVAGCGDLHVFRVAYDNLQVATAATTNLPNDLTVLQLANIFACTAGYTFTDDPAIGGTGHNLIHAVIPQSGSGTRDFFSADLLAALPSFVLGAPSATCGVVTGQEHDPTSIGTDANAVMPFSTAKLNLYNTQGYFGTAVQNVVKSNFVSTGFNTQRAVYMIVRETDWNSTATYSPAGSSNIWKAWLNGSTSWVGRSGNNPLIQAAGFQTPANGIDGPRFADLLTTYTPIPG
jgi:ABC-type phosphate transport system substrate-binding protein